MSEKKTLFRAIGTDDCFRFFMLLHYPEENLYVKLFIEKIQDNLALKKNYTLRDCLNDNYLIFIPPSHEDFEKCKTEFTWEEIESNEQSDFYLLAWSFIEGKQVIPKETSLENNYVLLRFRANWVDEINVFGLTVLSVDEWEEEKKEAKLMFEENGGYTFYVGSNQDIHYNSWEEMGISETKITEEEYQLLKKLNLLNFGKFPELY